jgi:integrase
MRSILTRERLGLALKPAADPGIETTSRLAKGKGTQCAAPGTHTGTQRTATHLLEAGYDIRTVQELLGHRDVRSTMTYLHVLERGALGVKSPLDRL